MKILGVIFLLTSLFSTGSYADDPPRIDGTYEGQMDLFDGPRATIALSAALTLTGETAKVEVSPGVFELVKVIDGNFLIDKEGGPFPFSRVTYRLETSEIDLRYNRTKGVTVEQPSSYRLVGKVDAKGAITGRVLSGFKGQIGTFKIGKVENKPLMSQLQYIGVWVGAVKLLPEGDLYRFGITIAPTGFATINPPQFEFDYSFGKTAHMALDSSKIELRNVVIDYLHRRVVMSDTSWETAASGLTVDAILDPKTKQLEGTFSSVFGGQRGEFKLNKLP